MSVSLRRFLRKRLARMRPSQAPATAAAEGASGEVLPIDSLRVDPGGPIDVGSLPRVSIVILNHNGKRHLDGCFSSLSKLDYPDDKLEVLLIDNGSEDGSQEIMRKKHGWVRLVTNEKNLGFTGGCNQGAELAEQAEVLVFLNNDMRVEPDWLRELVAPIVREECECTTAKMYSWDGKLINSAGGGMNFHGIGIQQGYMEEPGPDHDIPRRSLFACGGAMAIRADVFRAVGGFDPEYFAYYEDVDLGWRLWVLGYSVHYVPSAVCYHHHSSTSRAFPSETIRLLQVRNPILTCVKNYDDDHLRRILPALLGLSIRRMYLISGIESEKAFRIEHARAKKKPAGKAKKAAQELHQSTRLRRPAVADLIGINDFLGNWNHWMERRAAVQSERRRSDEEIFRLFMKPMWCVEGERPYEELQAGLSSFMGIADLFDGHTIAGADPHK